MTSPTNHKRLILIYLLLSLWLGLLAMPFLFPLSWAGLPILLCWGAVTLRLIFEVTLNRHRVPTLATNYLLCQKIAARLQAELEQRPDERAHGSRPLRHCERPQEARQSSPPAGKLRTGSPRRCAPRDDAAGVFIGPLILEQRPDRPLTIIDLGSGRGGLARVIAKAIPTAKVTGVELARFPYLESMAIQRLFGPRNLGYEQKDFWSFDCTQADAIVLYLAPVTAQKMGEKLARELKSGCLILSHAFPLGGDWHPIETLTFHTPFKEELYLYRQA